MSLSSTNPSSIKTALRTTGVTAAKLDLNLQKNPNVKNTDSETSPENPSETNSTDTENKKTGTVNDNGVVKKLNDFQAEKQGSLDQFAQQTALQQKQQQDQQTMMAQLMSSQQQAQMAKGFLDQLPSMLPKPQDKGSSGGSSGPALSPGSNRPKPIEKPEQNPVRRKEFSDQAKPAEKQNTLPDNLRDLVRADSERLHGKNDIESTSRSMSLINEYGRRYNLASNSTEEKDAFRRLVMHGVGSGDVEAIKADPKNSGKPISELASLAISSKNERELSQSPEGRETLKFFEELGFGKGELHQISSNQALEMYQNFKEGDKSSPSALFVVSNNHPEFDITKEIDSFKKNTGIQNVFIAQFDSDEPKSVMGKVQELADRVGPFSTLLPGGHGGTETASILFGNKTGTDNEKIRLDPNDKSDSGIVNFYQNKDIFKEGVSIIGLACNFSGNEKIKEEDSMKAFFQELRPDANVHGSKGLVSSFAYFYEEGGQVKHSNIDEPIKIAALDSNSRSESSAKNSMDNLTINFDNDFEDLEFNFN